MGVKVKNNLSWDNHINEIKAKALRNLGYIKRTLNSPGNMETKRMLYITLVRSILMYSSSVWSPYLHKDIISLESIQRRATKYMCDYVNMNYVERLKMTRLLPLTCTRECNDLILYYNIVHGRLNVNPDRWFLKNNFRRCERLNKNNVFLPVRMKTVHCEYFYHHRILKMWRKLPNYIKDIAPPLNTNTKPLSFKLSLHKWYQNRVSLLFDINNVCTWSLYCHCHRCRIYSWMLFYFVILFAWSFLLCTSHWMYFWKHPCMDIRVLWCLPSWVYSGKVNK